MDLVETLTTTGAVREFVDEPVAEETVEAILDVARFAPSGGNRQAWRVVVLADPTTRAAIAGAYLAGWSEYRALGAAGLVPFAPVTDDEAELRALAAARPITASEGSEIDAFALSIAAVPVLLAVLADLRAIAAVDKDLPRTGLSAGASLYPFAWSILLAARAHGLAGVMTTMPVRRERAVLPLLGAPEHYAFATLIALGRPRRGARHLRRRPVGEFATVDRLDGRPLAGGR